MRLFLDAHLSNRHVGERLRDAGHDVYAAVADSSLNRVRDEDLLALATREGRVMITCDVGDFVTIAREWAEAGEHHAGCIVIVGIDHGEFGAILRAIEATLADRPRQEDWPDHLHFASRRS